HNCEQLAAARTARKAREQELKLLMDRAEQSTGGDFVNLIAYKADYVTAQEDLKVIAWAVRARPHGAGADPLTPTRGRSSDDSRSPGSGPTNAAPDGSRRRRRSATVQTLAAF